MIIKYERIMVLVFKDWIMNDEIDDTKINKTSLGIEILINEKKTKEYKNAFKVSSFMILIDFFKC